MSSSAECTNKYYSESNNIDQTKRITSKEDIHSSVCDKREPTTILDLNEDCLRHLFNYLKLRDSLALAITCTQLLIFARQNLPSKYEDVELEIDVNQWILNMKPMKQLLLSCVIDFPKLQFTFLEADCVRHSQQFSFCEHIFKVLYENRKRAMKRLILANLTLPSEMPPSMHQFFQETHISELVLWNCYFPGRVLFPNVEKLWVDPKLLSDNSNMSLIVEKSNHGGFETFLQKQAPRFNCICCRTLDRKIDLRAPRPQMDPIECKTLFIRSDLMELSFEPHQLNDLGKLCVNVVGNVKEVRGNFSRSVIDFFGETNVDCVLLNLDFSVGFAEATTYYEPFLLQSLTKIRNLRKLELNDQLKVRQARGAWYPTVFQLIKRAPNLEEIEICTSDKHVDHFAKYQNKELLSICVPNGRKFILSYKVYCPEALAQKCCPGVPSPACGSKDSSWKHFHLKYLLQNEEYVEFQAMKVHTENHFFVHIRCEQCVGIYGWAR